MAKLKGEHQIVSLFRHFWPSNKMNVAEIIWILWINAEVKVSFLPNLAKPQKVGLVVGYLMILAKQTEKTCNLWEVWPCTMLKIAKLAVIFCWCLAKHTAEGGKFGKIPTSVIYSWLFGQAQRWRCAFWYFGQAQRLRWQIWPNALHLCVWRGLAKHELFISEKFSQEAKFNLFCWFVWWVQRWRRNFFFFSVVQTPSSQIWHPLTCFAKHWVECGKCGQTWLDQCKIDDFMTNIEMKVFLSCTIVKMTNLAQPLASLQMVFRYANAKNSFLKK